MSSPDKKVFCKGGLCHKPNRKYKCSECGLYICSLCSVYDMCINCYIKTFNPFKDEQYKKSPTPQVKKSPIPSTISDSTISKPVELP